jgi:hypothetical protein
LRDRDGLHDRLRIDGRAPLERLVHDEHEADEGAHAAREQHEGLLRLVTAAAACQQLGPLVGDHRARVGEELGPRRLVRAAAVAYQQAVEAVWEASAEISASTLRKLTSASTRVKATTKLVMVNSVACRRSTKSLFSGVVRNHGTRCVSEGSTTMRPARMAAYVDSSAQSGRV